MTLLAGSRAERVLFCSSAEAVMSGIEFRSGRGCESHFESFIEMGERKNQRDVIPC